MAYRIVWIDDDVDLLIGMRSVLSSQFDCATATSVEEGLKRLREVPTDLVLLDINIGSNNGLEALRDIKALFPATDVVMVTGVTDPTSIITAIRNGASDYLCKPFSPDELLAVIEKLNVLSTLRDKQQALIADLNRPDQQRPFIGSSKSFHTLLEHARRLKGHHANILITGESGTGKELMARYIHSNENEPQRPFIAVNCAAIPEGLIESELFGHEKGSFTGAIGRKVGKFELANGGDIFLDEISSLRLDLQAKILRVLQEREICRIGGSTTIRVNFRVIAATNDDLGAKVAKNEFRSDLYHRLRVVELAIPSLRNRTEDIPMLVSHFLERFSPKGTRKTISESAMNLLKTYSWPGNIRELENLIHSLVILTPANMIDLVHLPAWIRKGISSPSAIHALAQSINGKSDTVPLRKVIQQIERQYIEETLRRYDGDKSRAADALRIGRTTLYGKLKELGIED